MPNRSAEFPLYGKENRSRKTILGINLPFDERLPHLKSLVVRFRERALVAGNGALGDDFKTLAVAISTKCA